MLFIYRYLLPLGVLGDNSPNVSFEDLIILLIVLGALIFVWDLFDRHSKRMHYGTGLDQKSVPLSVRGSTYLPAKSYNSPALGLTGTPDAVVRENNAIIPVIFKPLSTKIRDRHVIELLVYLRLIEETEGERPPHGLIVLGKEPRTVRIKNTEEKQRWLSTLIDEMRSIMEGVPAVPTPAFFKCKSCDVNSVCSYSAFRPPPVEVTVQSATGVVEDTDVNEDGEEDS